MTNCNFNANWDLKKYNVAVAVTRHKSQYYTKFMYNAISHPCYVFLDILLSKIANYHPHMTIM